MEEPGHDAEHPQRHGLGGWPVRDDIEPAAGSIPLEDWNLLNVDREEIYYAINKVRDFWTRLG